MEGEEDETEKNNSQNMYCPVTDSVYGKYSFSICSGESSGRDKNK